MVPVVCNHTSSIFTHAPLKVVQNFIAMFWWCCGHLYQARKWWSFLPDEGDHTIVETSLTINSKHLWGLCIPNIELVQLLESPAKQCQPIYVMYSWANMQIALLSAFSFQSYAASDQKLEVGKVWERGYTEILWVLCSHLVHGVVCVGVFYLHHDAGVDKVGADHVWTEWSVLILWEVYEREEGNNNK